MEGAAAATDKVVSEVTRTSSSNNLTSVPAVTTRLTIPSLYINTDTKSMSSSSTLGADDYDVSLANSVPYLLNAIRGKPLVVSLVGLPGRGKTIISNKLKRFLLWNKIPCEVFQLSNYRRLIAPDFPEHVITEPLKIAEYELRAKCFKMLFEDVDSFFAGQNSSIKQQSSSSNLPVRKNASWEDIQSSVVRGHVAIFDFANTLKRHRRDTVEFCKMREYDLFFIETITDDLNLIQLYICGIEKTHPDYRSMSKEDAVIKFENHFRDYSYSYEELDAEEDIAFLKIFDGGSRCLVHNMNGYMQSKMVCYLLTLHFARQPIYITRHGEALNNTLGLIGGDSELTSRGFKFADAFSDYINALPEVRNPGRSEGALQVWTSVLKRAQQTASRIRAPVLCWNALTELDAGKFDGKSYEYIQKNHPLEFQRRKDDKFRYRYPDGESYDDLVTRLEPVIMELERTRSTTVIVCHQAVMRCLLAYLLNKDFKDLPYLDVPLHHVFKFTPDACGYELEELDFNIPSNEYIRLKNERKISTTSMPKRLPTAQF